MEGFMILDSENAVPARDKLKAEKTAKPCPGSVSRRKLADISNVPQKSRPTIQEEKPQSISRTSKEYTDQLQKEHVALVTMLAQRNKIIEQSGIELERLQVNLLKMQEQNQQLALSNTKMLAELNSGKDRLRALQHELGCKNGLLRARQLQLEEKARMKPCQNVDAEVKLIKCEDPGESLKEDRGDEKPRNTRKRLQSYSSSELVQSKDKAEKNRFSVRRQSARFKAEEKEPAEDLFEIRDARFPVCSLPDDPVLENGSISASAEVNNEVKECISAPRYEPQHFGRSSLGRPSRQAAKKVQSYKEIPINVKMRRNE
ncbi:SHUGOSHIN 1-like [Forsythia ovata]|uniref:SHUGOSHIN 1-like n=1 Tax=Forsythia ovata TaxID=205694 RepID=A0ABD1WY53_9LAMI